MSLTGEKRPAAGSSSTCTSISAIRSPVAATFDDEDKVKAAWQRTVSRSPLVATLKKSVALQLKFVIV
jgi:hypothetical protein